MATSSFLIGKPGFSVTDNRSVVAQSCGSFGSCIKFANSFRSLSPNLLSSRQGRSLCVVPVSPALNHRWFSSSGGGKGGNSRGGEVSSGSGVTGTEGSDIVDEVKDVGCQKTKEAHHELISHVQQLLDAQPGLIVVPSAACTAIALACVIPSILRISHKFLSKIYAVFFSGNNLWGPVPYGKSAFGAFEDPLRYLVIFMAISQIARVFSPNIVELGYVARAWKGAGIFTVVWCLLVWKTTFVARLLEDQNTVQDREKVLTVDKLSSVVIFLLASLVLVDRCGVSLQTIQNVCSIVGVGTAIGSYGIIENFLSGLYVQLSQPFQAGDIIKVGDVEGEVIRMGLTTTLLLSKEKFPILVQNKNFTSEVIVNKSRTIFILRRF